ncbi:hypothetical protein [Stenotrophomonas maltophilia group sp. CASM26]|uniref:hypothetical protein n=1 Tax=Stenotrophomonas TaxID=40323 RepID=UPI003BF7A426
MPGAWRKTDSTQPNNQDQAVSTIAESLRVCLRGSLQHLSHRCNTMDEAGARAQAVDINEIVSAETPVTPVTREKSMAGNVGVRLGVQKVIKNPVVEGFWKDLPERLEPCRPQHQLRYMPSIHSLPETLSVVGQIV